VTILDVNTKKLMVRAKRLLKEEQSLLPDQKDPEKAKRLTAVRMLLKDIPVSVQELAQQDIVQVQERESDPKVIEGEWSIVTHDIAASGWAKEAKASSEKFKEGLQGLKPKVEGLRTTLSGLSSLGIDGLSKKIVGDVKEIGSVSEQQLGEVLGKIDLLESQLDKRVAALDDFMQLVEALKEIDDPVSMGLTQVKQVRARFAETSQRVRNTEQRLRAAAEETNKVAQGALKEIEGTTRRVASNAVAWKDTKELREKMETVEAVANGVANFANTVNPEPISNSAMAGLHMLFKGIADGIKIIAWRVKESELRDGAKTRKGLDDLVGKLDRTSWIKMETDLIVMAISWVAEPLRFIPNVGGAIAGGIQGLSGIIGKAVEKAAEEQAAAKDKQAKKAIGKQIADSLVKDGKASLKTVLEENLKGVKDVKDYVEAVHKADVGIKEAGDLASLCTSLAMAVFGDTLSTLISKSFGELSLLDPEQMKKDLADSRASVDGVKDAWLKVATIKVNFGYDEAAVKATNKAALKALAEGESTMVFVAYSQEAFPFSAAVLIGGGHTSENRLLVESLIQNKQGFEGEVTMTAKGSTLPPSHGKLTFEFSDPKAMEYVQLYMANYGKDDKITSKTIEFVENELYELD
jgi:hypothetical protein